MTSVRRLIGILVSAFFLGAGPAGADVVTDWNVITTDTINATPGPPGPARLIEFTMVHLAMHDAIQAIQGRFETYSRGMTRRSGSVIAAAAKAAHDVLVNRFPAAATVAGLDAAYAAYLQAHQIPDNDPGVAAGQQAAAAIIQLRVDDGGYPAVSPTFFGGTAPGQWRPTVFTNTTPPEPVSMVTPWLGTMKTFAVRDSSHMFSGAPPRLHTNRYTRDYNEVKALGRNVGSSRTPEQTALAVFYSDSPPFYVNRTLRVIADRYITNPGDTARMFALVNVAMVDAVMTSWQSKLLHNFWRPVTAIQLGDTDGNPATIGDPTWQPLFTTPNYPDYTSGASAVVGAAAEMLRMFFQTDRVSFSVIGAGANNVRDYRRFSDMANDVVDARIYMGIHFRFPDTAGRSSGNRVARYVYRYFLRSLDGSELDFIRTLDDLDAVEARAVEAEDR